MKVAAVAAFAGAGLVCMLTAGCASAPTQFYTLISPGRTAIPATNPAPFQIEVLPIEVPAQVDGQKMVVREGTGEVAQVETRRWIAPLASEIRSALADDLSRDLGVGDVSGVGASTGVPLYRITLKVQRFDSALGAYAQIDAIWTIHLSTDAKQAVTCGSHVSQPVAPGYAALTEGHQLAIAAISTQIAQTLRSTTPGQVPRTCSAAS